MNDTESIKELLRSWSVDREWAEALICEHLQLVNASDVLLPENRGNKQLGSTEWVYRTHGVGVDVTRPGNKGGIDFDFNQAYPDSYRLRGYMVKQLNDGKLEKKRYRELLQNEKSWNVAFASAT